MIVDALGDLQIEVQIYEPNSAIKEVLQKQEVAKDIKLTPARASLLYSLFAFESFGEYSSIFAANKLAYFLQRMGQDLKLNFNAHHYGPYAIGVEKVLYYLNGSFLTGLEQGVAKPFEPLKLNYEKWGMVDAYVKSMEANDQSRLTEMLRFLQNFTSELSLEVLSTVDLIMRDNPKYTVEDVKEAMWTERKKKIFKKESIERAYNHLAKYKTELNIF